MTQIRLHFLKSTIYGLLIGTIFFGNVFADDSTINLSKPFKIVDASSFGYSAAYGYGPSIMYSEGKYHSYFCSTGSGSLDWDHIRYSESEDLIHWTTPISILESTAKERADCDPTVVRFDAGDGLYYYMMFSGNVVNVQTVNFLARSKNPEGPFYKFTDRGTWERNPPDSRVMQMPAHSAAEGSNIYGAGQPTLVILNGTIYQWYTDTTVTGSNQIFLRTSRDMIHWSVTTKTNAQSSSIDVKYDDQNKNFLMVDILDDHSDHTKLVLRRSLDGITWSEPNVICDEKCFPKWTNNVGMSGDESGHLYGNKTLIGYGAPFDLSPSYTNNDCNISAAPYCWAHWDIFGQILTFDGTQFFPPGFYHLPSGTVFKTTESNHVCGFPTWEQFIRAGGVSEKWTNINELPTFVINDGTCPLL